MRIFQSVSGHSSEQSVTRYSSQPTASQLYGVSDTIPKWFRNLQSFNNLPANQSELRISIPPSLTLGSFHSKLELNDLQYWPQPQVFQAYFFNCCNIQGNVQAFLLTGLLWSQQLSVFSSIFFNICRFRNSILLSLYVFIPRESTLMIKASSTVAWFSWANQIDL